MDGIAAFYDKAIKSNGWEVTARNRDPEYSEWRVKKRGDEEGGVTVRKDPAKGSMIIQISRTSTLTRRSRVKGKDQSKNMRRPIIAGNWKMYKTIPEALEFVRRFKPLVVASTHCEIVIAPVFTAIKTVADRLEGSNIEIAAQDAAAEPGPGAFTGEVSAAMIKDAGARLGDHRSFREASVLWRDGRVGELKDSRSHRRRTDRRSSASARDWKRGTQDAPNKWLRRN